MVEECFGKMAKISVDEIRADHLPAILIVYKVKGSTDIKNIIQGVWGGLVVWVGGVVFNRASLCTPSILKEHNFECFFNLLNSSYS